MHFINTPVAAIENIIVELLRKLSRASATFEESSEESSAERRAGVKDFSTTKFRSASRIEDEIRIRAISRSNFQIELKYENRGNIFFKNSYLSSRQRYRVAIKSRMLANECSLREKMRERRENSGRIFRPGEYRRSFISLSLRYSWLCILVNLFSYKTSTGKWKIERPAFPRRVIFA